MAPIETGNPYQSPMYDGPQGPHTEKTKPYYIERCFTSAAVLGSTSGLSALSAALLLSTDNLYPVLGFVIVCISTALPAIYYHRQGYSNLNHD